MRIDGKLLAQDIFDDLTKRVAKLKKKNITPHLVIFLVGDDPASQAYVRQKVLKAELIGARATVYGLPTTIYSSELLKKIETCNNDNDVHGIIVQRPLPPHIDPEKINAAVSPNKDIDSFRPDSPHPMPLAASVLFILEKVHATVILGSPQTTPESPSDFISWLQTKNVVIMGKGETGGGPTIELLRSMGITPHVIDSKTPNPDEIVKSADILIAAIGKSGILKTKNVKQGAILIAVGMHKGSDGKLHGDYEEEEIKDIAGAYTPVPGGVGPVNVAMLLKNLTTASESHP